MPGSMRPATGLSSLPEMLPEMRFARHMAGDKVPRTIEIQRGLPRQGAGQIFKLRLRDPY